MAHILAQKQLRSIILSVSLPIPFSSLPLQCPPVSPPLCLCLSVAVRVSTSSLLDICNKNDTCHIFLCFTPLVVISCGYFFHTCSLLSLHHLSPV